MTTPEDWVWLARIRRPQGRKGEVFADILTDFPEKFAERKRLWLLRPPPHLCAGGACARAKSNSSPLAAQGRHRAALCRRGLDLSAPKRSRADRRHSRAERAALAEDEVYIGDLIGCALVDVAGAEPVTVGEIEDVDRTAGPVALLVVQGAAGEVLVPFAKSYLRKIDLRQSQARGNGAARGAG
jgi:16S rRNA processing protein RimM